MQTTEKAIVDITVNGQGSIIRIEWKWNSSAVNKIKIFYKKQGGPEGDGGPFTEGPVVRLPDSDYGFAEKDLLDERGLYVFTFIPLFKDGEEGERCEAENIMLGRKITVFLSWHEMREGVCACFSGFERSLPEGAVECRIGGLRYTLYHPVYDGFEALFPGIYDPGEISLTFADNYCQMYEFQ